MEVLKVGEVCGKQVNEHTCYTWLAFDEVCNRVENDEHHLILQMHRVDGLGDQQ